jgi:ribonuclease P protein component
MRRSTEFSLVVRSGRRARRGAVVVHQVTVPVTGPVRVTRPDPLTDEPIVGLIVGKSVGDSVVRHRVSRRLRAQLAQRLSRLPAGSATVVRALPAAGHADSASLGADLDQALAHLLAPTRPAGPR